MMKTLLTIVSTALLVAALPAQISGSINRNAAKVDTSIAMGDAKLALSYTALRFGRGDWQKILENTEAHEGFNKLAENKPVGMVKTSVAVTAAGKEIPAGEYKMFFTVHAQAGWILNLKAGDGEPIRWRLMLKDGDEQKCLKIALEPSDQNGTCGLTIAFGKQSITVPVSVAAKAEK